MGRTTRWIRNLLGGKKEVKESKEIDGFEERRDYKKRWSFKSGRDSAEVQVNSAENAAWLRSIYSESEREQSKHAIGVAAATAEAAVAAARAAVEVVRLTSRGRGSMFGGSSAPERLAATKIQAFFRAYLAKKALRALRALVKLQALVRGYLVRKQAAATLRSMQALIRAQAAVRSLKSRAPPSKDQRHWPEMHPRRSLERFDETRTEQMVSNHSGRPSGNLDRMNNDHGRSIRTVEIDTCRSKSSSSCIKTSPFPFDPSEEMALSSLSIPDSRNFQDYDWCRYSCTAQSTPRYVNSAFIAPPTPAKSVECFNPDTRRFLNLPNCPNYMTNTQSFEAKVRSQSAPKQRPEVIGLRKRVPLSEILFESRASLSGIGMQRSCTRAQDVVGCNFKSAVLDRLDKSIELGRDTERDFYLQKKW